MSKQTTRVRMNPEIRARWTAWLRANVDKQTTGRLNRISTTDSENWGGVGFCCLGGLCELAVADGIITTKVKQDSATSYIVYGSGDLDWNWTVLPSSVLHWAGLSEEDPEVLWAPEAEYPRLCSLTQLNDDKELNFNQIADLIDEQL